MQVKVVKPLSTILTVGTVAELIVTGTLGAFSLTIGKITESFGHDYRSYVEELCVSNETLLDTWEQTIERVVNTGDFVFEKWWKEFYGTADEDEYMEADEYYMRKAFAYFGWKAQV